MSNEARPLRPCLLHAFFSSKRQHASSPSAQSTVQEGEEKGHIPISDCGIGRRFFLRKNWERRPLLKTVLGYQLLPRRIFKTHQFVKRVQSLSFHLHSRETWNSETTRPWRVKFKTSVSNNQESRTKAISLSLSRRHLGATPRCCKHWLNFWLVLVGGRDRNHLFRYLTIRKHPFWSAWHACQSF